MMLAGLIIPQQYTKTVNWIIQLLLSLLCRPKVSLLNRLADNVLLNYVKYWRGIIACHLTIVTFPKSKNKLKIVKFSCVGDILSAVRLPIWKKLVIFTKEKWRHKSSLDMEKVSINVSNKNLIYEGTTTTTTATKRGNSVESLLNS